jgi:hypothetical protein
MLCITLKHKSKEKFLVHNMLNMIPILPHDHLKMNVYVCGHLVAQVFWDCAAQLNDHCSEPC